MILQGQTSKKASISEVNFVPAARSACSSGFFLLITRDDGLDALLKVRLRDCLAAVAHGAQRALVDDVGKLCAGSARRHTRDGVEVHIVAHTDFARMHAQDGLSALQVRQLHRHPAVKAARTRQRRIE